MMHVNLLGTFGVSVNGARIHSDLGPAGQRMAAFLFAFPDRLHRRERIADLFWPDLSAPRSRAALNSALWRLRKLLSLEPSGAAGENLKSLGTDIVLELKPWLEVDALIVAEIAKKIRGKHENSETPSLGEIRSAIELYEGPFLESEDVDLFIEERERLHTCFVRLCRSAIEQLASESEYSDAIDICRKVIAIDPFRELFIRHLIALLCLNEQRVGALRFYEEWRRLLDAEIGVDPMPETAKVFQQVKECRFKEDIDQLHRLVTSPSASAY